ncbi:CPBP family intramembrane metalloprotease [Dyella dinghuensis]|uniref:CPBP family intramembrane metalloprotease n=1 Tax=Dyella dinghuensis TaxID=1920169 RepID=A0A3S0RF61_9GAMM|nr:type II CAAX endopeptidase family protein [Dyella dinghuensis]RUL65818.1 CPBP family intramembrane metalloprotease [Dyella dinghuensis]
MASRALWNFELGNAGLLSPGKTLAIRCFIWAAILYAIMFGLLFASVFAGQWLHLSSAAGYVTAIVMPILGFLLYALIVRLGERRAPSEIFFQASSLIDLVVGAVIGIVILSLMLLLLTSLGLYSVRLGQGKGFLDSFVFDSYISGMLEELAFRAVLLRLFARMFNPLAGLLISSALFGIAHLTHATPFQAVEVAFNAGLTLGLPYMLTGRLWMSVGLHIAWDFWEESLLGVNTTNGVLISVPDLSKPVYLTGGAYGPDGSLLASLIAALAIVAMLYAGKKGWLRPHA